SPLGSAMTTAPSRVNLRLSWPVPASPQEQAWTTRASAAVAASRLQVRFMPIPPLPAGGAQLSTSKLFFRRAKHGSVREEIKEGTRSSSRPRALWPFGIWGTAGTAAARRWPGLDGGLVRGL